MVGHLPSMCEVLGSIPVLKKRKQRSAEMSWGWGGALDNKPDDPSLIPGTWWKERTHAHKVVF